MKRDDGRAAGPASGSRRAFARTTRVGSHRLGCLGSIVLGVGLLIAVLVTVSALLAGCWGVQGASEGIHGTGFQCHSQECVDDMREMAAVVLVLIVTQVTVLVLVLWNRRTPRVLGIVGAPVYAIVALGWALRSQGGLTAYLDLVAAGGVLLALGSAIRVWASGRRPAA